MYKIITKNCTVRKLILLGVKVYFNDKRGGLAFQDEKCRLMRNLSLSMDEIV